MPISDSAHSLSGRRIFGLWALSLALLLACLASPVLAQSGDSGSISGRVAYENDHEFVLSTAILPDLGLKTDVNSDGSFSFEDVQPGKYLVEVRVPSLGVVAELVEVVAGEQTGLELDLVAGLHSEEIIVSAFANARDPNDLASPTTSLSGHQLAVRSESSLGETLAQEAGIHATFFGPGASRPIIRGLGGDRIRMLEDGIGSGDASTVSEDHAVTVEIGQVERIEVIRGPGTLLYGSSAIGGVVNIIDERIPTVRGDTGVHGEVELRGGTVSDERFGSVNLNGSQGNWAWDIAGSLREADEYEIPGFARVEEEHDEEHEEEGEEHEEENPFGVVPNTDIETQSARVGGTYFFGDKGFFGISVSGFDTDYGLPGGQEHGEHEEEGEHDEDGEEHDEEGEEHEEGVPVRLDMEQRRFDLRGQINQPFSGIQAVKLRLGATDYEHLEFEGEEEGTVFFNDFLESRVEFVQAQRGNYSGSFGVQFLDRDLEAIGAEAFIPASTTQRLAVFALQEYDSGPVTWQFGARFENQDSETATQDLSFDGLSASLGLVWRASETFSVAVSAARSVRLPAAEELFSDGLHVATQAFEIGDPTLDEEVGFGFDLSFRAETGAFSGELTFYRQDFSDFIFQAFTGEEEEGFPVVLYSQEDAIFDGLELKARLEVFKRRGQHVHLTLMGDLVDAELDSGGNLPRISPTRFGGGVHYHSDRWDASAEVRWIDDQNDVGANETPTEGYTMVNASLGYRLLFGNRIVDFLLRGRNLGDEEARVHTSFLKNVAPLPGRNVTLSAKLRF